MGTLQNIEVAIEANSGDELLTELKRCEVDVVVCDIRMSPRSGIDVVHVLRERGDMTPVLLLTTFDDPALLRAAIHAKAQGFMLKDAEPEMLAQVLERLMNGETWFAPVALPKDVPIDLPDDQVRLSPREIAVLRFAAGGYSNKEIARAMSISDGTVKNYMSEILQKLAARDRTHAVLKAIRAHVL
jgi:DNA-binding NarL/FixJ family response regulator